MNILFECFFQTLNSNFLQFTLVAAVVRHIFEWSQVCWWFGKAFRRDCTA